MRFIGKKWLEHDPYDRTRRREVIKTLDTLAEYQSGFDYDLLFMHHKGKGVDVEPRHGFLGRFMKADTPVPNGFISVDFVPQRDAEGTDFGPPYLSQFSFAVFTGDVAAMHRTDGYDSDVPDVITVFKGPHERCFSSRAEIVEEIGKTVVHEIGHYFGIDDARLYEMGY